MTENYPKRSDGQLRLLQVASGDLWAGAEVQLFSQCEQLQDSDEVTVYVALLNEGELAGRLRKIGVAVTVLDESRMSFWALYLALAEHCRDLRPDIIHSHRQKENILAAFCGLRLRIPSIRTVHGAPEFGFNRISLKKLIAYLDRWVGRHLQRRVVAVSDDLAQKLKQQYPASHVETVRNGVARDEPIAVLPTVKLAAGHKHIGIVGRLVPVKRIDLFLEMAAIVIADDPNRQYQFWIVGDGPLREASEALTQSLGIADRVNFVGHLPSALPYLQALDLLVMCSDHEGTPMTMLEAMQCKLPVVAHDVGGLRELLDGGECGHLVQDHTAKGYAQAIKTVMQETSLTQHRAQNGIDRVLSEYSAEKNCLEYLAIYRDVLNT